MKVLTQSIPNNLINLLAERDERQNITIWEQFLHFRIVDTSLIL